jgi:hypothetical protein
MKGLLPLFLLILLVIIPDSSFACYSPEHLTVHYSKLIERTSNIVLAEVTKIERLPREVDRYHFKTIEALKGNPGETFLMEFRHLGYPRADFKSPDYDFDRHRDGLFWNKQVSRQWNWPDCEMYPFFTAGVRYLIFRDRPYHYKSFERIIADDDRWLQAVRTEIRTGGKQAGFSQTIDEYLSEKKAVYVYRIEACPKRYGDPDLRQHERIRGVEIRATRFWPDFGEKFVSCAPGFRFLTVHYEGEDPRGLIHPSAFPLEGDMVDFSNIATEIEIVGDLKIPLQELRRRLR